MNWVDKAHRENRIHKQVEQAMKDPRFQLEEKKKLQEFTTSAFNSFVLLSVDYMHRELGFGKKRIEKYLHEISKYMGYISKDDEYFKLLNMELKRETGVDVLAEMGMEFEKE